MHKQDRCWPTPPNWQLPCAALRSAALASPFVHTTAASQPNATALRMLPRLAKRVPGRVHDVNAVSGARWPKNPTAGRPAGITLYTQTPRHRSLTVAPRAANHHADGV